jgi:nucleoside-diphosphate-sugar epimerase
MTRRASGDAGPVEPLRTLLIGGTGFLSGQAARALLAAGHEVTVFTRGRRPVADGLVHVQVDRTDPDALARVLEGRKFDFTVDFTAFSAQDVERLLLVPYAALGRYVLVSSGQVYLVTEGAREPCAEEASEGPLLAEPEPGTLDHEQWAYGIGKRQAEGELFVLRESYGVRATALRLPIAQCG